MGNGRVARISSKGQVVLPKIHRAFLGLSKGDYIYIKDVGPGVLLLSKIGDNKNVDEAMITVLGETIDTVINQHQAILLSQAVGENR